MASEPGSSPSSDFVFSSCVWGWFLRDGVNADGRELQMYEPPRDRQDAELLRQYMSQVRQELAVRLLARVFEEDGDGRPSKWWLSFTKRKFMGKSL